MIKGEIIIIEEWKYIEGSDNCYVSNLGKLKRYDSVIPQYYDSEGYLRATVKGVGRKRVHQFVALAFIPNPQNKPVVNHIDGGKDNNNVNNLEWCTYKENSQHAGKEGLLRHGSLTVRKIVATLVCKNESKIFENQSVAARELGIDDSEVNKCLKNKRNTSHGYMFSYLNEKETT